MSIVPKRVSLGENVLIHICFRNIEGIFRKLKYESFVVSPSGKKFHVLRLREKIVPPKIWGCTAYTFNEFFQHEYHVLKIKKNFEIGKYKVDLSVWENNRVSHSQSYRYDYFFVEKITVKRIKKTMFSIKNESRAPCPIRVHYKFKHKHLLLKGQETRILKDPFFLIYANNDVIDFSRIK